MPPTQHGPLLIASFSAFLYPVYFDPIRLFQSLRLPIIIQHRVSGNQMAVNMRLVILQGTESLVLVQACLMK